MSEPRFGVGRKEGCLIQSIGVVGAGTMGNGIAQVAARAGFSVVMHDVTDEFLNRGLGAI